MDMPAAPAPDAGAAPAPAADDAAPGAGGGTVLCTVMSNGDGTYTLVKGDEEDAGVGGEAAPAGQTFDSPGALLKGILEIVQDSESAGEGSADDNFDAGYVSEGGEPTPPAGAAGKKY